MENQNNAQNGDMETKNNNITRGNDGRFYFIYFMVENFSRYIEDIRWLNNFDNLTLEEKEYALWRVFSVYERSAYRFASIEAALDFIKLFREYFNYVFVAEKNYFRSKIDWDNFFIYSVEDDWDDFLLYRVVDKDGNIYVYIDKLPTHAKRWDGL